MQKVIVSVGLVLAVAAGVLAYRSGGPYGAELPYPGEIVVISQETGDNREDRESTEQVSDTDQNGALDTWTYWAGPRIERREIDDDENGLTDWWEYYGADEQLERVGFSSNDDGVHDATAYLLPDGSIGRIEHFRVDDGSVRRTEHYEADLLVRSEDDTDGDGQGDERSVYRPSGDVDTLELD